MKTFEVSFSYQDRKNGPAGSKVKVDASSLPGAIAKATRTFMKELDRKQRFDVNKSGLEIKAIHLGNADAAKENSGIAETASHGE